MTDFGKRSRLRKGIAPGLPRRMMVMSSRPRSGHAKQLMTIRFGPNVTPCRTMIRHLGPKLPVTSTLAGGLSKL